MGDSHLKDSDTNLNANKDPCDQDHDKNFEHSSVDHYTAVDSPVETESDQLANKTKSESTECDLSAVTGDPEAEENKSKTNLETDSTECGTNVMPDHAEVFYDAPEVSLSSNLNTLKADHDNNDFQISTNQPVATVQSIGDIQEAQTIDESVEYIQSPSPSHSSEELARTDGLSASLVSNQAKDQYDEKLNNGKKNQCPKKSTGKQTNRGSAEEKTVHKNTRQESSTTAKPIDDNGTKPNRLPCGACGLQNIGSTCYMNSALQCVSNVSDLTEYFLKGTFRQHLNVSNVLGTRGDVARAYNELISRVWSGNCNSFSPDSLKRSVARYAPQFADFRQQDSQEFMNFLLDALHEDLKVSDYDEDCNNSKIAEIFHSKLRSTVECPTCSKPEVMCSNVCFFPLPIPSKKQQQPEKQPSDSLLTAKRPRRLEESIYEVIFVDETGACKNYAVEIPENGSVNKLIEVFLEKYKSVVNHKYDGDEILAAQLCKNKFMKEFSRAELLSAMPKQYTIALYYLPHDVNNGNHQRLWCDFHEYQNSSTFRPPIYLSLSGNNCTIETIRHKLEDALPSALYIPSEVKLVIEDRAKSCGVKDSFDHYQIYLFDKTKSVEIRQLSMSIDYKAAQIKVQANRQIISNYHSSRNQSSISAATSTTTTLQQCIEEFFEPEKLGANGQWYCNNCHRFTDATKKLNVGILAPVLIMQLKRFDFSRTSNAKINTFVEYPVTDLDMKMFVTNSSNEPIRYNLVAVSHHSGSLSSGHYSTSAKNFNNGRWYRFNDSSVSPLEDSAVVTQNAYVLVYSRQ